jgi:hypothetical protein
VHECVGCNHKLQMNATRMKEHLSFCGKNIEYTQKSGVTNDIVQRKGVLPNGQTQLQFPKFPKEQREFPAPMDEVLAISESGNADVSNVVLPLNEGMGAWAPGIRNKLL